MKIYWYASIRKSQHKLKSVKLNDISTLELKQKKINYEEDGNINDFMYNNWPMFLIYNINDVMLQKGIENKTNDVMTYFTRSHSNITPFNKIFRETHLLRNVREQYFEKQGYVQGNNLNTIYGNEEEEARKRFYASDDDDDDDGIKSDGKVTFKGAINAEPKWNAPVGRKVHGRRSNNIHHNAVDFDMGAFYPSIKIASNMDSSTLLYKASFVNSEFISLQYHNKSLNQKYEERDKNGNLRPLDFTGEAVNTYAAENYLTFAYNYLNIDDVGDLEQLVAKRLS